VDSLWLIVYLCQRLIESNRDPLYKSILDSTLGIFFLGAAHHGLRTNELEVVDNDSGGQRSTLLQQLKEGSEYLENQKEDLLCVWECFKGKIISFYELNKTICHRKNAGVAGYGSSVRCTR
jgi:hypothetical protein